VLDHAAQSPADRLTLTPRESEVLEMIAVGMTNAEVAERLDVTVHAVKFHLGHIYRKLGVSNRTEAAVAFQTGAATNGLDAHDAERRKLLFDWNATDAPYPTCAMHELFAERAAAQPDALAVIDCYGDRLTYGELDRRANALARYLRAQGVGPETLVGIATRRSVRMLEGLLGILKAGGAYVPIDPAYPEERIQYMVDNADIPVLVTEEALLSRLPIGDRTAVCIDRDWSAIEAQADGAPFERVDPESLAYVIYTSGSTGNPKGVQVPHRALVNFLTTMAVRPGLSHDDVLLAVTTLSFDIAGLELYLPLVTGASVVIASQEATANPQELAHLLDAHGVTVMQATPTTWRMLIDAGWDGGSGIKALCGGEALPLALADALVERGLELWNMYGPTETTIWSTTAPITTQGVPLTIGRPIANTTLYVLDEELAPVDVGEPGELHIGGAGLARGYRGRPDLTEERFLQHPFDPDPQARIYKTGDLVRYRDDGEVEYLGRLDHQVKIRGFRIELGEIETVLARHPSVREAVAVAREDTPGDPRIVAYVRQPDAAATAVELREYVGRSLPPYMVPSTVVTLEQFPLTLNGKVDRKALPAPVYERSESVEYVAPRTQTERRLVKIWQDELGVDRVGITDDFFDFGATSIVAARLIARVQRSLAKDLALAPIFEARTIEQLARVIDEGGAGARWTSLVPMQTVGPSEPIFCVHGGAGTVLHLEPLARLLAQERPFYALQSRGLYGGAPPLETVEEMADHYLREIRTVQPVGPYYLAGYCFGTIVAFEMAHRLRSNGEAVNLLAMFNGPSSTWLRMYGGIGGQPSRRARRAARAAARLPLRRRVVNVLRSREKIGRWIHHGLWRAERSFDKPLARISRTFDWPLPERVRERYFLATHRRAELSYQREPYEGQIIMFSGAGLYDDPTLGWSELATEGVVTEVVPGNHRDNRDVMREPYVSDVAEKLVSYLHQHSSA
jgi:amino acid adenylation domain-containing protein